MQAFQCARDINHTNVLVTLQVSKDAIIANTKKSKYSKPDMETWQCLEAFVIRIQIWDPQTHMFGKDLEYAFYDSGLCQYEYKLGHKVHNIKAFPSIERLSQEFQKQDGTVNKIFSPDGRLLMEYKYTNQEFDPESCKTQTYPESEPREILNIVPKKLD